VLVLALLMVSTVKYRSFKELELLRKKPFRMLFLSVVFLILIAAEPTWMLFTIITVYVLSGIFDWVFSINRRRRERSLRPA
jgi:CDP-diacylglycerol--serine O-phosphatidyltransferase